MTEITPENAVEFAKKHWWFQDPEWSEQELVVALVARVEALEPRLQQAEIERDEALMRLHEYQVDMAQANRQIEDWQGERNWAQGNADDNQARIDAAVAVLRDAIGPNLRPYHTREAAIESALLKALVALGAYDAKEETR